MKHQIESKYKNPDKYIERLKKDIAFLDSKNDYLNDELSRSVGRQLFNHHAQLEEELSFCLSSGEANLRQEIAIEGIVTNLSINNKWWDNISMKIASIRLRKKS